MAKLVKDQVDRFFDYDVLTTTRTLWIGSPADEDENNDALMAERAVKGLHLLETASQDPITIKMNNVGGDTNHHLAIFDAILTCPCHVMIQVYGHAMSMGAVVLQAADERVLMPNSSMMIHYGELAYDGHAKNLERLAAEDDRINRKFDQLFLTKIREKHPDYSLRKWQKMVSFDKYFTPEEAVALGLADRIWQP